ncbi:Transcription initiation factor [Drechslerella dactyloides]|uniref:Transcription initiation factor n=1 Tax=Drechslerella dactyloides TaxID=74499 RepID=A0AAD6J6C3_DREDA|nr:Transcription initiation factor [Drechslerella dactyloides]
MLFYSANLRPIRQPQRQPSRTSSLLLPPAYIAVGLRPGPRVAGPPSSPSMTSTPLATSFDTNPDTEPLPAGAASTDDVDMTSTAAAGTSAADASMSTTVANTSTNANGASMTVTGENGGAPVNGTGAADGEGRGSRRERNLREFLGMMDEYAPIIPDAVTDYYLSLSGFHTSDVRIKRLLALATQKFIADIAADAYQFARIRTSSSNANAFTAGGALPGVAGGALGGPIGGSYTSSGRRGGRMVLTMDDLGGAAAEYGVNTKRPEFYR